MSLTTTAQHAAAGTGLQRALSTAVKHAGLAAAPDFSETLQPKAVNWVVADRASGLVGRARPTQEIPLETARRNLADVSAAHNAGAPVIPPALAEPLVLDADDGEYVATVWPLATNRRVTPDEMAEMLRNLHDTPPPPGLRDWLDVRHGTFRERSGNGSRNCTA